VSGRKRQVLVDTLGLLLGVVVHPADESDSAGGRVVLAETVPLHERLAVVWADQTYRGSLVDWARNALDLDLSSVKRPAEQRGFVPQPKRWTVERFFGWMNKFRRLSKDDEGQPETTEAWIYAAMSYLLVRRLARAQ
jgi:putative transposase